MYSKKMLLGSYAVILLLGISSMLTHIHYFANIAGFLSAVGFMYVFFKEPKNEEEMSAEALAEEKAIKKKWYIVFATGIIFSLIFGSFWNSHMGNMA